MVEQPLWPPVEEDILLGKRGRQAGDVQLAEQMRHHRERLAEEMRMMRERQQEMATRMREMEEERGGHAPTVALTASARESDKRRCLESGMDAFLSKPLTIVGFGLLFLGMFLNHRWGSYW